VRRFSIKGGGLIAAFLTFSAATLASCGLVDLRPVAVTTAPAEAYATLASRTDPVTVSFSAEPVRLDAERAFSVRSPAGTVEGDFAWDGAGFSWRPVALWDPGVRYRLTLDGSVRTVDGREARERIDLPFFVGRSTAPPFLESYDPDHGSSVGVSGDGSAALTLRFSEPMDTLTVREAFAINPSVAFDLEWNESKDVVRVVPRERLAPLAQYSWTLGSEARSRDGAPVARTEKAGFVTDLDSEAPSVERTFAAVLSGGEWREVAPSLSGLDAGHSLAVRFSEAVVEESVLSCLRLEPSLPGRVCVASPRLVVFTPDRGWGPEEPLALSVSADVEDLSGIRMSQEYRERFTPAVPFLEIVSATSGSGEDAGVLDGSASNLVTVGGVPDGLLSMTLHFSAAFGAEAKVSMADAASLSAFFPGSLPAPSLRSVSWFSDDSMTLTWEGLRRSDAVSTNYYVLAIPGGAGGAKCSAGLYLEDDATLILEAKE